MKFRIRHGNQPGQPEDPSAHLVFESDSLRIGRSPDNELVTDNPYAADYHGVIRSAGPSGGAAIESMVLSGIVVNGKSRKIAPLKPYDIVSVGHFHLRILAPDPEHDFVAEIITPQEAHEHLLAFHQGNRTIRWIKAKLHQLQVRPVAWFAVVLTLLLLFIIPLTAVYVPSLNHVLKNGSPGMRAMSATSWSIGPVSRYHIRIADECEQCHTDGAFTDVPDKACYACHEDIRHHFNLDVTETKKNEMPLCGDCHQEHIADNFLVLGDRVEQCLQCHTDITQVAPKSKLQSIPEDFSGEESLFARKHPEFVAAMVSNHEEDHPIVTRVRMDDKEHLKEHSGLVGFSHKDHLKKDGILAPDGKGGAEIMKLECWSCHKPDDQGVGMKPLKFEDHCQRCHQLTFDELAPSTELPHGKAEKIFPFLKEFYAGSPKGTRIEPPSPPDKNDRELPGRMVSRGGLDFDQPDVTLDGYTREMTQRVFEKGVCSECHQPFKPSSDVSEWRVVKPKFTEKWYPAAKFEHQAHAIYGCTGCHQVESSESPEDVNIPAQASCTECHDADNSNCLKCHTFHKDPHFNMKGTRFGPKAEAIKPWHGNSSAGQTDGAITPAPGHP